MIERGRDIRSDITLDCDLVVVGTGAGGAMVAREAARAGPARDRARGGRAPSAARLHAARRRDAAAPVPGRRRPHHRRRRHHRAAGPRRRRLDGAQHEPVQARAGGGARRLEPRRLARQRAGAALRGGRARSVGGADRREPRQPQQRDPARAASRSSAGRAASCRTTALGCVGSGFCELGCAFDAKQNALKVLIPAAVGAGARVIAECRAERVLRRARARRRGAGARARRPRPRRRDGDGARARGLPRRQRRSARRRWRWQAGCPIRRAASAAACGCIRAPPSPASSTRSSRGGTGFRRAGSAPRSSASTTRRDNDDRSWIIAAFAHPIGPGLVAARLRRRAHEADAPVPAHRRAGGDAARSLRGHASPSRAGGRSSSTRSTAPTQRALVHGHGRLRRDPVRRRARAR